MSTRAELRAKARKTLGNGIFKAPWLVAVVIFFAVSAISGALSSSLVLSLISILITGPITIGVYSYFLKYIRYENELKNIEPLFDGFKKDIGGNIILYILQSVFLFLWSLLFVIPGIVKAYSYALAYYIKIDNPGMKAKEAIDESRKLMNGHKMELFLLDLSFIGWLIIGTLAFGFGLFWVIPYMQVSHLHFYEEIKPRKKTKAVDYDDVRANLN